MPHRISQPEAQAAHQQQAEYNPQQCAGAKGQLGITPAIMSAIGPALTLAFRHALFGLPAVGFFFVKNSPRQSNPASKISQPQCNLNFKAIRK
jgi:tagatose-1,6-bisphosphate aldolase non-catalytic subunit AgaZ/GatZ